MKSLSDRFELDPTQPLPEGVSRLGISEQFSTSAPISLYGATKLSAETLALEYMHAFQFPVWINRCGVMAGASQFGRAEQGIYSFWLHSWREQRPLKYIGFGGNGRQVRDLLHPHDLSRLVWQQLHDRQIDSAKPRLVNVSGGMASARSLSQLSAWCAARWGEQAVSSDPAVRPYDLPWIVLDHSLASATWGWQPAVDADAVLDEIAQFADANPNWLAGV